MRAEQRVGRQGSAGVDAERAQAPDRRCDDGALFAAHFALLPGVRVESGYGEARLGNAEVTRQCARGNFSNDDDGVGRERFHCPAQAHMHGNRNDAKYRADQHHHRLKVAAGERGEELRMARKAEPSVIQYFFVDWIGDDCRRLPSLDAGDGGFDGGDHRRCIDAFGSPRDGGMRKRTIENRQRLGKSRDRLGTARNSPDWHRQPEIPRRAPSRAASSITKNAGTPLPSRHSHA